ncbi:hypothetical protein CBL_00857 [Carabus blaptoides fortunei]
MSNTTKSVANTEIPWMKDTFTDNYTTEIPPVVGNPVLTIVAVAIAVIITIVLLFGLAVFIDCRHQRLRENGKRDSERSIFNFAVPKFLKFTRFTNEDDSFVDKMYSEENAIA